MFFFGKISYGQIKIPDLAQRTLDGKLETSDFEDQKKYMVNIDTLCWGEIPLSGEFTYFTNKKDMIIKITNSFEILKTKEITHFAELENNLFYSSKIHWFMILNEYRIDWWFSNSNPNKLDAITLVKTKNGI